MTEKTLIERNIERYAAGLPERWTPDGNHRGGLYAGNDPALIPTAERVFDRPSWLSSSDANDYPDFIGQ